MFTAVVERYGKIPGRPSRPHLWPHHYHIPGHQGQSLPEGPGGCGDGGVSGGQGKPGDAGSGKADENVGGAEALFGRPEVPGGAGLVQLAGPGAQAGAP